MHYRQRNSDKAHALEAALKTQFQREYQIEDDDLMLEDVETVEDIFDWLEFGLSEVVFADLEWYNGDPVDEEDEGYVMFYNKPISPFQLVQHRIKEEDATNSKFTGFYPVEWPRVIPFDEQVGTSKKAVAWSLEDSFEGRMAREDKKPFGPLWDQNKYEWSGDKDGAFGGGGYFVVFNSDRDISKLMLRELKKDRWIDKQTRRVMAIAPFFNGNYRLFALARLVFELDAGGGVSTRLELRSTRLELYRTPADVLRVILELLVFIAVVIQAVAMGRAFWRRGRKYFLSSGLNCVDFARIIASFVSFGLYIRTLTHDLRANQRHELDQGDEPRFGKTTSQSSKFLDLPSLVQREDDYYLAASVTILLTVMVLFKYLMPFPRVRILVESIVFSFKELSIFLALILVVAGGYSVLGVILFGHVVDEFKSFPRAFVSICRFAFDVEAGRYDDLVDAAGIISTSLFYWTFLIVVTVLFLNIALAIVLQAYEHVKLVTDHLKASENLNLTSVLLRYCLLFREPSLAEQQVSFLTLLWNRLQFLFAYAVRRKRNWRDSSTPQYAEKVTDSDLLRLFRDVLGIRPHHHADDPRKGPKRLEAKITSVQLANEKILAMRSSVDMNVDWDEFFKSEQNFSDDSDSDSNDDDDDADGREKEAPPRKTDLIKRHHHHHLHLRDVPLVNRAFLKLLKLLVKDKRAPFTLSPSDVDGIANFVFERHAELFHPPDPDLAFKRETVGALNDLGAIVDSKHLALHAKIDLILEKLN